MPLFHNLIENIKRLTAVEKILDIPLLVTEQCPDKLGNTIKELNISHAKSVIIKTRFSMAGQVMPFCMAWSATSSLCKQLSSYWNRTYMFLPLNCVASRLHQDRYMALELLRSTGCFVKTTESIIYDLLRDKKHPEFNNLRKLLLIKSQDMKINSKPTLVKL